MASSEAPSESALLYPSPNWFSSAATSVSRDGRFYAFAARNTVAVLTLPDCRLHCLFHGHFRRANGVSFCFDGSLCSIGQDKSIRAWDVVEKKAIKAYHKQIPDPAVVSSFAALAPERGNVEVPNLLFLRSSIPDAVVIGGAHGRLLTWRTQSAEKPKKIMVKLESNIVSITTVPGSEDKAVVGGENGSVVLVDVQRVRILSVMAFSRTPIQCLTWVAYPPADGAIESVSSRLDQPSLLPSAPQSPVLIAGGRDGRLHLLTYVGGQVQWKLLQTIGFPGQKKRSGHGQTWTVCTAFATHASGGNGTTAWILGCLHADYIAWKIELQHSPTRVVRVDSAVRLPQLQRRLVFGLDRISTPSGENFRWISTSMDRTICLCEAPTDGRWKDVRITEKLSSLGGNAISADTDAKHALAVGCVDRTVRIADLDTEEGGVREFPQLKWRGVSEKVTAVKWCPEFEHLLAFGCHDGRVGFMEEQDRHFSYACCHREPVRLLDWQLRKGADSSSVSGAYALYSLGAEGCLLGWPDVYRSDWKGAEVDSTDSKKLPDPSATRDTQPVNVSEVLEKSVVSEKLTTFRWTLSGRFLIVGTEHGRVYLLAVQSRVEDAVVSAETKVAESHIMQLVGHPENDNIVAVQTVEGATLLTFGDDAGFVVACRLAVPRLECLQWSPHYPDQLYALTNRENITVWDVSSGSAEELGIVSSTLSNKISKFLLHPTEPDAVLMVHECHCLTLLRHDGPVAVSRPGSSLESIRVPDLPSALGKRPPSVREEALGDEASFNVCKKRTEETEDPATPKIFVRFDLTAGARQNRSPFVTPVRRTGRRKLSTLRDSPISQRQTTAPTEDAKTESFLPLFPPSEHDPSKNLTPQGMASRGLFKSPTDAVEDLVTRLNALSAEKLDVKTAERIALRYLWAEHYSKAADILFSNDAMTGEFLSFFTAAGKNFYRAVVSRYVECLKAAGEVHLAAMHLTTLGNEGLASKVYREAGLHDDAICLGGIKFLKSDPRLRGAFCERGRKEVGTELESVRNRALDLLIGREPAEALQVLEAGGDYDNAARLACKLLRRESAGNSQLDVATGMAVIRKCLLHAVIETKDLHLAQELKASILQIKEVPFCGEVLFADVLDEINAGHFGAFFDGLRTDLPRPGQIFEAGLVCLTSFKQKWDLTSAAEPCSMDEVLSGCQQMHETSGISIKALCLCQWFLFELTQNSEKTNQSRDLLISQLCNDDALMQTDPAEEQVQEPVLQP